MQRLGQFQVPIEIPQLDIESGAAGDDASQLATTQRVFTALWQSFYVTDPQSGTMYPGHVNDNLWRDDASHRPALDWLISYIPTSDPPKNIPGGSTQTPIATPTARPPVRGIINNVQNAINGNGTGNSEKGHISVAGGGWRCTGDIPWHNKRPCL